MVVIMSKGNKVGVRWRRVAGYVSIAVGAVAITLALAVPKVVVPHYLRLPAEVRADTLSIADDASLIDAKALASGRAATETGVPLRFSVLVSALEATDRTVTMQAATRMYRADRSGPEATVSASVDKVTLDRYTSRPTGAAGLTSVTLGIVDTTPRRGHQYKLPFDTRAEGTYLYYDDVARMDLPLTFVDDDRRESGMGLLHFRAELPATNLFPRQPGMQLTLPASYWGLPGEESTRFELHYSVIRDLWVEPVTGLVIESRAQLRRVLARPEFGLADPAAVTTLRANTHFDADSLAQTVDLARTARTQILWGRTYAPIALGGFGVIAVAAGAWMMLRSRRTQSEDAESWTATEESDSGTGDPSSTSTSDGNTTVMPRLG